MEKQLLVNMLIDKAGDMHLEMWEVQLVIARLNDSDRVQWATKTFLSQKPY